MKKHLGIGAFVLASLTSCDANNSETNKAATPLQTNAAKNVATTEDAKTTNTAVEDELLQSYLAILNTSNQDFEEKEAANAKFKELLIKYAKTDLNSITSDFKHFADQDISIVTSDDKSFKIYSWDTGLGGTMQDYATVMQYKVGDQIAVVDDLEENPYYFDIITVEGANNKTYYLAISNAMFSNKDGQQSVKAFTLENGKLNSDVKLFKTSKTTLNNIDVAYDFFSVVDHEERPVQLIKYDKGTQTLKIPVVKENGTVTKNFLNYKFDGNQFVYTAK